MPLGRRLARIRLFPEVVDAIQSVQGDDIRQYIGAIRQSVCSVCPEQLDDGSCEMRQRVGCALDAYLLLIVDTIEEAAGRSFPKDRSNSSGEAIVSQIH